MVEFFKIDMTKKVVKNSFHCLLILMIALFVSCDKGATGSKAVARAKGSGSASPMSAKVASRVGYTAPNFTLLDLDGNQVSLSDMKGKVVMLNFWATWCGPCKMEMPSMERLHREFNEKDFKILAVSSDYQGASVVKPYIREYGYTFTNLIDKSQELTDSYNVHSIPMTYLVDQDGVITNKFFGARNWDGQRYKELIAKLIKSG